MKERPTTGPWRWACCVALLLALLGPDPGGVCAAEPPCVLITNEIVKCIGPGAYQYAFSVTNHFTGPVSYLAFVDLPAGLTVTPPVVFLPVTLAPGQGTNVSVTLSNAAPTNLCFRVSAHNADFGECCVVDHCVTLPECCLALKDESLRWTSNGLACAFTVQNLSLLPVYYVSLVPLNGCFSFAPPITYVSNGLAFGQSASLSAILQTSPACGSNLCFLVAIHDALLDECCSVTNCIFVDVVPPVIRCPTNRVVDSQGPAGTPVAFTVTATDNLATNVTIICTPPSGFNFPPGTNLVTCVAVDDFCNSNRCTFLITVVDHVGPTLSISLSGTNITICWPVTCDDCVLECTLRLNPPILWTPISAVATVMGDRKCVVVPIGSGNRFYRLRRP